MLAYLITISTALASPEFPQEEERRALVRSEFIEALKVEQQVKEELEKKIEEVSAVWNELPRYFLWMDGSSVQKMVTRLREIDSELRDIDVVRRAYLDFDTRTLVNRRTERLMGEARKRLMAYLRLDRRWETKEIVDLTFMPSRQLKATLEIALGPKTLGVRHKWYLEISIEVRSSGIVDVTFVNVHYEEAVNPEVHRERTGVRKRTEISKFQVIEGNRIERITWLDTEFPDNPDAPTKWYLYEDYLKWKTEAEAQALDDARAEVKRFTENAKRRRYIEDLIEDE